MFSSAKRSYISEDNINKNNNMNNIIQGKKINFNEEVSNLNLIQNKNNSNIYKSAPKEDITQSLFFSQPKPNFNDITKNSGSIPNPQFPPINNINLPPSSCINSQNQNINNKIINVAKKENQINNYQVKNIPKISCTCTRTQCQKKYCACFSYGIPCQGCECKGCLNTPKEKENNILLNKDEINVHNIDIFQENKFMQNMGCNCTKSHCLKKYCECFKMFRNCGSLCRCMDCQNKNSFLENNENVNISNINNGNLFGNNLNEDDDYNDNIENLKEISKTYDINAFGIFIENKVLLLQERKIDLTINKINLNTTPKLTNKKRSRTRNESSSLRTCPTTNSNSRRRRTYAKINMNVKTKKLNL